jgi:hypothetical protein
LGTICRPSRIHPWQGFCAGAAPGRQGWSLRPCAGQ